MTDENYAVRGLDIAQLIIVVIGIVFIIATGGSLSYILIGLVVAVGIGAVIAGLALCLTWIAGLWARNGE